MFTTDKEGVFEIMPQCHNDPNCKTLDLISHYGLEGEEWYVVEDGEEEVAKLPQQISEEAYCGVIGEFIDKLLPYTEASRDAMLIHFLAGLGVLIGGKAHFQVDATKHYPMIFTTVVGATGEGRKGTALSTVKPIFEALDHNFGKYHIKSGLASGEGLVMTLKSFEPKAEKGGEEPTQTDIENADKRLLLTEGEFASLLTRMKREKNTLSAYLRNGWDRGVLENIAVSNTSRVDNYALSIIGHIIDRELIKQLDDVSIFNGFANRFLWILSRKSKDIFFPEPIDPWLYQHYASRFMEGLKPVLDGAGVQVKISPAIKERFIEIAKEIERDIKSNSQTAEFLTRGRPYVLRIAMIYALTEGKTEIELPHLEAAYAIWKYNVECVNFIFSRNNRTSQTAERILQGLHEAGGEMSQTDITNIVFHKRPPKDFADALKELQASGKIEAVTEKTKTRKKVVWKLRD